MEANKTQVAGTHYRSAYQHWDFVLDADLDYFSGQITKYVARWRAKNGAQDLLKAAHFARKLSEVQNGPRPRPHTGRKLEFMRVVAAVTFCKENQLDAFETEVMIDLASDYTVNDLRALALRIEDKARTTDGSEAGPDYVDQS